MIGEIRALACTDGSCDHEFFVGEVQVLCTHPDHIAKERVEAWEERLAWNEQPELTGLKTIIDNSSFTTYAGIVRP